MLASHAGRVSAALLAAALLASGCGEEPKPIEPTTFKVRLENVAPYAQLKSGVYHTRVGGSAPGPLAPGDYYEFSFTAGKGQKLSFASMLGQSNDWIFSTPPGGIDLYEGGSPISGEITSSISLWDVGTEADEEPAVGPHTGPNQASSTDGPGAADPNTSVRKVVSPVDLPGGGWFHVPPVEEMIRVLVAYNVPTRTFTVLIQNVAKDDSTLMTTQGPKPVRISPGVWTLSTGGEPLFSAGMRDRGQGLEALAESGNVTALSSALASTTGVGTPVSPGIYLLTHSGRALFTLNAPDSGQGLERIAEDGNVTPLYEAMRIRMPFSRTAHGIFNTPEGASAPGPAHPGQAYTFEVRAHPGARLSFVTMFGMSNDWFFGTEPEGIFLFDEAGQPLTGDFSSRLQLYDAGTEQSEELGIGPNTGPQQGAANTGLVDNDTKVRKVPTSEYATPVTTHLKLTISR
ncbi:MAG: spondin domain-containing protein [Myxococcaceae bacterium]|nr:spondin domain-containing protein [Myxococcaceae bacterium]